MSTKNQLLSFSRIRKITKKKTPALNGNPQVKGSCNKVFTRSPKKPNSASRKVVKLEIRGNKFVEAYVPGEGHNLQSFAVVLIRGGRTPDLPGVKYKLIIGKYDFDGLVKRKTSRSQYGTKKRKKIVFYTFNFSFV
jgi:small subunit ribosomal protein S12